MMTEIVYASSLQEAHNKALERVDNGPAEPFIISLVSPETLIKGLARVRHGIFDFDDTLVSGNQHALLRERLSPETADFDREILNWLLREDKTFLDVRPEDLWFSDQRNPQLLERAMFEAAFIAKNAANFQGERINRLVIDYLGENMQGRGGAAEIFSRLEHTCIITYGFLQIVEAWCRANGIQTMAAGVKLIYDAQGKIAGFHPGSLVTGASKGLIAKRFRLLKGIGHEPLLAMGDRPFDLEMMNENQADVNALIFTHKNAKERFASFSIPENIERWERVTCVLISDSLEPLVNMLRS